MKIPIVDENDNIIEYRERDNCDINAIYRVSSLWITDNEGKILLARRAFNKVHDPGKWGPAVAGTVEEGETYEENIIKETEEEIGLKDIKPIIGIKKRRKAKWNYFAQEFLLTLPTDFNDFKIQEDEVAEVKWFSEEELRRELKESPDDFLKWIHERMSIKLILGSDLTFLLKYGYDLTDIPKNQMKIGYVTTASQGARNFSQKVKDVIIPAIKDSGYPIEEIDIKGKSKKELKKFFKDKNVIQLEGGNTFYLLKAIQETGFAEIIKESLNQGKIYIGTSAGSYVMCPTIDVADWNDETVDRYGVSDFTALNYVPFVLRVHYKDEAKEEVKEKMKTLKYPLRILKDGQGILVENNKYIFVGDGEEVKLN
jgi:dipeptidase E